MKTAIIIPARFASSRLPAKPLLKATGKYLIQHVYENALKAKAERVIVATDDDRIYQAVRNFGGEAAMTRADHPSGTDRIAEVAKNLDADLIINLQGDEPQMDAGTLDYLSGLLEKNPEVPMATLGVPIHSLEVWKNPNCVKIVCTRQGRALYFSRSPIPFVRDGEPDFQKYPQVFLHHLGLYAYRREFLLELATLPPEPIEEIEKLEQLRVLALGFPIQVGIIPQGFKGVDTPEDYEQFVANYSARGQE